MGRQGTTAKSSQNIARPPLAVSSIGRVVTSCVPFDLGGYFPRRNRSIIFKRTLLILLRATSHLSVTLTAMHVTVNEVSSYFCKILTLIMIKTYLQTGRRRYRIARCLVVKADSHVSGNRIRTKRKWTICY